MSLLCNFPCVVNTSERIMPGSIFDAPDRRARHLVANLKLGIGQRKNVCVETSQIQPALMLRIRPLPPRRG